MCASLFDVGFFSDSDNKLHKRADVLLVYHLIAVDVHCVIVAGNIASGKILHKYY